MAATAAYFSKNYGNLEKPFSIKDNIRLWKMVKKDEKLPTLTNKIYENHTDEGWKTILYDYNCYYDEIYRNEETLRMQFKYLKEEYDANDLGNDETFDLMMNDPKDLSNKYRDLIYPPCYEKSDNGSVYPYFPEFFGWDYGLKSTAFDKMRPSNYIDRADEE